MAFCTNCGASVEDAAKFCTKCGAAVAGEGALAAAGAAPAPPPVAQASAPAKQGSSALKIVLIAVGVLVVLGILAIGAVLFVGYKIARNTRVTQDGKSARIETPIGTIEAAEGGSEAADKQCAETYPNSTAMKHGAAVRVGGLTSVICETEDSPDKVAEYFKAKFPDAAITAQESGRQTLVAAGEKGATTIVIEPKDDGAKITVAGWQRSFPH